MAQPHNDLADDAKIIYRWTNTRPADERRHENEAEEYIVEELPEADSGVVIYGRYGDEIIANTWSNRALVKHLVAENKQLKSMHESAKGDLEDTISGNEKTVAFLFELQVDNERLMKLITDLDKWAQDENETDGLGVADFADQIAEMKKQALNGE